MRGNDCEQLRRVEMMADEEIERISGWVREIRRQVHAHPELAHEEKETSELVAEVLKAHGWDVHAGVAEYGVIGVMHGAAEPSEPAESGYCIAFRADMDALPIQEETGAPYASCCPGKMHACGHDNHVAIVLGMAAVLSKLRRFWSGAVKLIFEPAEETGEGALMMINAGALRNPDVGAIVNLAVGTAVSEGKFRLVEGPAMPQIDNLKIDICGEASHGGEPHRGVDAIVLAAEVITVLQRVVSRQVSAADPVILNIQHVEGGRHDGILPDYVTLTANLRSFSDATARRTIEMIRRAVDGVIASYGGRASVILEGRSSVVNYHDPVITRLVAEAAADVVGSENVIYENRPDWGGDSFAYYTQHVPGTFAWIGVRNEECGRIFPVHHPKFDVDDSVLPLAVRVGCRTAIRALASRGTTSKLSSAKR